MAPRKGRRYKDVNHPGKGDQCDAAEDDRGVGGWLLRFACNSYPGCLALLSLHLRGNSVHLGKGLRLRTHAPQKSASHPPVSPPVLVPAPLPVAITVFVPVFLALPVLVSPPVAITLALPAGWLGGKEGRDVKQHAQMLTAWPSICPLSQALPSCNELLF
eukprot:1146986-Pelagomonas_calceolata.AAC.6